jgi:purine-binding chemotaxis protein CheW
MTEGRASSATQMAREFDATFARPWPQAPHEPDRYLALRIVDERYAVNLLEVRAVLPVRRIVAMPSKLPALLGLSSVRGEVVPVYSLAKLLQLGQDDARWLLLFAGKERVAFAVSGIDGYLQPEPGESSNAGEQSPGSVQTLVTADGARAVLSLAGFIHNIEQQIGVHHGLEE